VVADDVRAEPAFATRAAARSEFDALMLIAAKGGPFPRSVKERTKLLLARRDLLADKRLAPAQRKAPEVARSNRRRVRRLRDEGSSPSESSSPERERSTFGVRRNFRFTLHISLKINFRQGPSGLFLPGVGAAPRA